VTNETSQPLTDEQLNAIETAIAAYETHPELGFACCSAHAVADHGRALVAEVRRLRAQSRFLINAIRRKDTRTGEADRRLREFLAAAEPDPICGDPNDGDWCELEPGHEGNHRADTAEWPPVSA
jgi:hypothetical protein